MNKVVLMGRLTKDPELRFTTTNNTPLCNFTLAVDRRFQRPGEERQADFIPIVVWSKLAEFCAKYFQKGKQVAVVGRIQTRSWDDPDGKRRYMTEVVAEEAYFAEGKKSTGTNDGAFDKPEEHTGGGQTEGFYPMEEDDDLPF